MIRKWTETSQWIEKLISSWDNKLNVMRSRLKGWPGWSNSKNRVSSIKLRHLVAKIDYRLATRLFGRINWKSPKVIGATAGLVIIITGLAFYLNSYTPAYAIMLKGERIAVVQSKDEAVNIVNSLLNDKGKSIGQIAFSKDPITYEAVRVKKAELNSERTAAKDLEQKLEPLVKGYAIKVNGQDLFTLGSKQLADEVLQKVKDNFAQQAAEISYDSVSFDEKVEVSEIETKPENVDSADKVLDSLLKGKVNTISYQIESGDTLWTLARNNSMSIKDLLDGNPGLTPETVLQIGQKIDIVKAQPYLNVVATGTQSREELIPFGTVYKTDGSLAPGKSKTVTEGSEGIKQVSFKFTSRNGDIVEKVVLSETVKEKPVSQVVAKGPAAPRVRIAASRGSGSASGFAWPLRGAITSGFGRRWGRLHTGIDIDGNTGQVYYAALDGKVIAASWEGSYGNRIVIDHGNGVQTLYAHSSKFLVSPGQTVRKGQPIGLVGTTGRVTGPHLHFEIQINGRQVNPLGYL